MLLAVRDATQSHSFPDSPRIERFKQFGRWSRIERSPVVGFCEG
jgi:hypothetical protein